MSCARIAVIAALLSASAFAQSNTGIVVNCANGASLQQAVTSAPANSILLLRGACRGPVTINKDGLRLLGGGTASVNGEGNSDVLTVFGAQRIELNGLQITGGINGVVATGGAQIKLVNDTITGNQVTGVVAQTNSSVTATGASITANGFNGIDVEGTSSLTITGADSVTGNGVFGIEINNGSSLSLTQGSLTVSSNTVGVQLGTNASGFLDPFSTIEASNNFALGVTMVSGAHMVDFGGTIHANGNGINGISLNSKAALDMDAAAQVTSSNNGSDGVHMEQLSVMSIFNNPQFSGTQGTTTLTTQGNHGDGVDLLMNSNILVDNYAAIVSTGNSQAGLATDDGSSVTFRQTIPVSGVQTTITGNTPDLLLTFGSRLTILGNDTYGTVSCDATVLTRGVNPPLCPQGAMRHR